MGAEGPLHTIIVRVFPYHQPPYPVTLPHLRSETQSTTELYPIRHTHAQRRQAGRQTRVRPMQVSCILIARVLPQRFHDRPAMCNHGRTG